MVPTDREALLNINPIEFDETPLSPEMILLWFSILDAGWIHDNDPKHPHAKLTSGKCSNGFFDCLRVLRHPNLNEVLAKQLVAKLKEQGISDKDVDWVVGSPYAGITFSYEVAKAFQAVHGFAEKQLSSGGRRMIWPRSSMAIPKGARVLQVEELITTSKTFQKVRKAIEEGNQEPVEFLSVVGALIHRPPHLPADYDGRRVVAAVEKEIWAVESQNCPLCRQGSERLEPKTNWPRLTQP